MEYQRNQLFFHYNRTRIWTGISLVAYVLLGVAFIVLLLTGWWLPAGLPFIAVGAVILVVALNMMTSEKQIKQQVEKILEKAKEEAREAFDYPEENPDLLFSFDGYDFDEGSAPFRRMGNGRSFSAVYTVSYFLLEKDRLRFFQKKVSLVEDKASVEKKDFPFASLTKATADSTTLKRHCIDGKEHGLTVHTVAVTDSHGNPVCLANDKVRDYDMDRFCETLAHCIQRASQK